MALGNGATEIITGVVAAQESSGKGEEGIFLSVGAIIGSGMAISTLTLAIVIIFSQKEVKVSGLSELFRCLRQIL